MFVSFADVLVSEKGSPCAFIKNTSGVIVASSVLHNICRLINITEIEPEVEIPAMPATANQENTCRRGRCKAPETTTN